MDAPVMTLPSFTSRSDARWWLRTSLQVHYDPHAKEGLPGDVLIGIGHSAAPNTGSFVILNHKVFTQSRTHRISGEAAAQPLRSVADFVAQVPSSLKEFWRACFPAGPASIKRLVVEDASLDTCMALLLFARAISVDAQEDATELGAVQTHCADDTDGRRRLGDWLAYVTAWEEGRYTDGNDFELSAACQLAALAHSELTPDLGPAIADEGASKAVRACLTLLDGYIGLNAHAIDAQPPRHLPEFERADAQLVFERQQYLLALKHGTQTQLNIPLKGSRRSLLVDALIVKDQELSGVLKVLARNDRARSSTGRGFALLGLHRETLAGTGGDMVISVDPAKGITLEDLWVGLEKEEDRAWSDARPRDLPRRGIARYTDPTSGAPTPGTPNQPWYDEGGKYTLLAAPKEVSKGVMGSKLGWETDVLPLLWRTYAPFKAPSFDVLRRKEDRGPLVSLVKWPRREPLSAAGSGVMQQWLASCSAIKPSAHPGEFPSFDSLICVPVPGGEAIAHPDGVTLSDDWTDAGISSDLIDAATTMAGVADSYSKLLKDCRLTGLGSDLKQLLQSKGLGGEKQLLELRRGTLALKQDLIELSIEEEKLQKGTGHRALLDALSKAWDLPDARHQLWDTVSRIEELLEQAQALQQARGHFFMTRIVSAAGVFVFVHELIGAVGNVATMNEYERLLIIAERLGIDGAKLLELQQNSELSDFFDWSAVAAWCVIFAGALALAWRKYQGVRVAASERPDLNEPSSQPHKLSPRG